MPAKKKKRKPTKTKLKKKLWPLVAISVKMRDNFTCVRCGKKGSGSSIHASHILPKGEYPKFEFEEWNLKCLCMYCHLQWWHKNPLEAYQWFVKKFPKRYQKILEMAPKHDSLKNYSLEELQKKIDEYKGPITW